MRPSVWCGVLKSSTSTFKGRHFTLVTDHQPLVSVFNPRKGIPVKSRWALFLGAHSYDIELREQNNTAMQMVYRVCLC